MPRIVTGIAVLVVLAVLALAASYAVMGPSGAIDLSRSKPSAGGLYRVGIAPEVEPLSLGTMHSWVLTLTTPDGKPVEGATIKIGGGMPQHGHGLPTAPQATASMVPGRYRIDGVRFNMAGNWILEIEVSAAPGRDTVSFNVAM